MLIRHYSEPLNTLLQNILLLLLNSVEQNKLFSSELKRNSVQIYKSERSGLSWTRLVSNSSRLDTLVLQDTPAWQFQSPWGLRGKLRTLLEVFVGVTVQEPKQEEEAIPHLRFLQPELSKAAAHPVLSSGSAGHREEKPDPGSTG